jgi:hypothetical protein
MECSGTGDFARAEPVPPEQLAEWNKHAAEGHEINTRKSLVLHPVHDLMYVEISGKAARVRLPKDLVALLGSETDVWLKIYRGSFRTQKIVGVLKVPRLYSPDISIDRSSGEFSIISSNVLYSGQCNAAK